MIGWCKEDSVKSLLGLEMAIMIPCFQMLGIVFCESVSIYSIPEYL